MTRTVTFETVIHDQALWIEAEVTVSDDGPMYSDQDGGFGPATWSHEVDSLGVFNEQGDEVTKKIDANTERAILNEIERRLAK